MPSVPSRQLRLRYDVPGPRYTSYPTADRFHSLDTEDVYKRYRKQNGTVDDPGLACYLHIPFCKQRCLFCACTTEVSRSEKKIQTYLHNLEREFALLSGVVNPTRAIRKLSLGGGTPNILEPIQIIKLIKALENTWSFAIDAERSVEIDPRSATQKKLDAFIQSGFNRFSLGVQDLDEAIIDRLRPGNNSGSIEPVVSFLRQSGIELINFDLIYGLPGQTTQTIAQTVQRVIEIEPTRVALYSYAHVPKGRPHQKRLQRFGLPSADQKLEIFLTARERFLQAGYVAIGMDHFALPQDTLAQAANDGTLSRNFMGYTTGAPLDIVAFGATAISFIGSAYAQNHKRVGDYQAALGEAKVPIERGYLLTQDDMLRRTLITCLSCNFTLDLKAFDKAHGISCLQYFEEEMQRLQPLVEDGLVQVDTDCIRATELGRYFIRNICMVFDKHLQQDKRPGRPYSRTV